MYSVFIQSHSYLRYFILIMLIAVIFKSLMGWLSNKPYSNVDNKLSLYLLIFTHLQLLAGFILYFISPAVKFGGDTMANAVIRYWTVEHALAMIIAIVLITFARISSKKMTDDKAKFKRLVIFNSMALIIILATISMSGRPIL